MNYFKDIKEGVVYYMFIHRFFTEKQRRKTIEGMEKDGWKRTRENPQKALVAILVRLRRYV